MSKSTRKRLEKAATALENAFEAFRSAVDDAQTEYNQAVQEYNDEIDSLNEDMPEDECELEHEDEAFLEPDEPYSVQNNRDILDQLEGVDHT